ncbi:MAG: hypothetical protein IKQ45_06460 [Clostridia bacterium]|nr:hypothetical protein [Clostridia bacterium]
MNNLNHLCNELVRDNHRREMEEAERAAEESGTEYQGMIDTANRDAELKEMLRDVRGVPGRDY